MIPSGRRWLATSAVCIGLVSSACAVRHRTVSLKPTEQDATVLARVAAFSKDPSPFTVGAFSHHDENGSELKPGWFRYNWREPGDSFSCEGQMVRSEDGVVAGWEYLCGPTGRKQLPEFLINGLDGDWLRPRIGHSERYGQRYIARPAPGLRPKKVDTAFRYLSSPLERHAIGPAYPLPGQSIDGLPKRRRPDTTQAVTEFRVLVDHGRTDLIEELLDQLSPEARVMAAYWIAKHADAVSEKSAALAEEILESDTPVSIRTCHRIIGTKYVCSQYFTLRLQAALEVSPVLGGEPQGLTWWREQLPGGPWP